MSSRLIAPPSSVVWVNERLGEIRRIEKTGAASCSPTGERRRWAITADMSSGAPVAYHFLAAVLRASSATMTLL
jgi:hypothetical protein